MNYKNNIVNGDCIKVIRGNKDCLGPFYKSFNTLFGCNANKTYGVILK